MSDRRIYQVVVPATPRPKQRTKSTRAGTRHYTPAPTVNQEAWVRLCCTQQAGTPMVPGPVAVVIGLVLPLPGSWPKRDRADALSGKKQPLTKPDWDNLAKLVCDALNGIAWRDDAHVTVARCIKVYGEQPRTVVRWWQMTPEEAAAEARAWGLAELPDAAAGLL
jgi:Holliday junction resolvase RusA-like endonuclease